MADDYFDLIVWYADDGRIHGFQLCYDKRGDERALTWTGEKGFQHHRVDDGDSFPTKNGTPILVPGGEFAGEIVMTEFERRSGGISAGIRELVLCKLVELVAQKG
jgi:hypothetical protein